MDATNNFVLDGSVTMVWGFEDEADEYAEAILERMPDLQAHVPSLWPDLWPQLFSDVSCIALWISSEKILTRLYSVLHWFHKRLEANVKKPRENRCFQTVIVFSFSSFDNSKKCTVLLKIAARLITVSTSVNKEMWVKLSSLAARSGQCPAGRRTPPPHHAGRDGTVHSDPWCFSHYRR